MKALRASSTLFSAVCALLLAPPLTYAMSGMDMPLSGQKEATASLSKNMDGPINSSEAEIEITYSADGKTAIFVSGRQGSIPSPAVPTTSISGWRTG